MPVPVLVGIPWLISAVVSAFGAFVTFIGSFIVQRGIINTLLVSGSVLLLVGFIAFIDSQISIVLQNVAGYNFGILAANVIPSSTPVAIGMVLSADVARFTFDYSQALLDRKFK